MKQIIRPRDQSLMMAVASVGDLLQGTNPNGAIVDELHVHKNAEVIDALESGTGARAQPLILIITTADGGDDLTVYATRRKEIEDLCKGTITSTTKYAVVFGARKTDDPFAEETWAKANPGYPISPTREFMQTEAENAKNSPLQLTRFQRLNLNIRTKTESKFVTMDVWDRNAGEISDEREFLGAECYGGIDLASVSDLSAVCWLFPQDDGTFAALWRIWTPEANLERLDKLTNGSASLWVEDGWLETTPGNVTDYDYIETQIVRDVEAFDVMTVGYDPYNANQLVTRLRDKHGVQMVKVRQGFLTLSQPLKQTQRLLLKGTREDPRLRHGGNPVMRWMTDNLAVESDAAGNVKPSKKVGMSSGHKIDGWSALVTGCLFSKNHCIQWAQKA
jgi:phage terminase large subunit-like protein